MLDGPRWGPKSGRAQHLVVLCHGVGADGHDVIDLGPWWAAALPQAAFVAPDAPEPYDAAPTGRQWFPLWDRTPDKLAVGADAAALHLGAFVDAELARLGLPADAYALMGFSQGAMTVLHAGPRRTVPPRAVLAFSGALLAPERLAETPSRPPVLLVHGEADEVVPAARSRAAEQALAEAGFAVESLFCPRLAHGIDEAGLSAGALFLQRAFAAEAEGGSASK
jgi:phospholipase/carboxylesterase